MPVLVTTVPVERNDSTFFIVPVKALESCLLRYALAVDESANACSILALPMRASRSTSCVNVIKASSSFSLVYMHMTCPGRRSSW